MNDLKIISKNELSTGDIKTIINVINDSAGKDVISKDKNKPLAKKYSLDDSYVVYMMTFSEPISGDESDSIVGGLYNTLEFDFVVEINSDMVEYDDNIEENIEDRDQVLHARWVQEQVSDGWSYGLEFNEEKKQNPYIRPYHQLTKSQKKLIDKSKSKLGHYGIHIPYLVGDGHDEGEGGE